MQDLKYPYLHPMAVEKVEKTILMVWQMYYQASRDFLNKKLEDWAALEWQLSKILTNTDLDKDGIVSLEQNPQGITVKFWGIPKIRDCDPKRLAELLDTLIDRPNRYLNINDDILYSTMDYVKPLNNHHIVYRAALASFDNECFEETAMAKLVCYPELPNLDAIVGEPVCLQYYTTVARRAVWAMQQNNVQWENAPAAINNFVDWISENLMLCASQAYSAFISTAGDLYAHQDALLPDDAFMDGVISELPESERLAYLEQTPIVMCDLIGNVHMLSGAYKRRILSKNNEQTMRVWVLQAKDVWNEYKKS